MRRAPEVIVGWLSVLSFGCTTPSENLHTRPSALEEGVLARVGPLAIGTGLVEEIASTQAFSMQKAREQVVRDSLFGLAAEEAGFDELAAVRSAIRARLARGVLAEVLTQTQETSLTDAEVEAATARHFLELDRPEGFRVIHAVARVAADADDAKKRKARELAQQIATAVAGASDAAEFENRGREISAEEIEVRIESLEPVAADGRLLIPSGGALVEPFAAAAARLVTPGEHSPVIETEFGFHVMMLLERTPAVKVPLQERRVMLREEILATRAREATEALLGRLRKERGAEVERSAEALMQSLQVLTP